jgi:hypothetical protein
MTAAILSIDEQVAAMRAAWPQFAARRIDRRAQSARWVGSVRPQYASYSLEIRYEVGSFPEVRVLSPELVRLPGNSEGQLPHVYPPAEDPTLCLFDPREREWTAEMTIATTTVPWALDWLACYELWVMTGRWTGGGRHAGQNFSKAREIIR